MNFTLRLSTLLVVACGVSLFARAEAFAGSSSGSAALALSAIGGYSPTLSAADKRLLLAYLNGQANAPHPPGKHILVKVNAIDCRASDVDIALHACTLTFGAKKVELSGRAAHEVYATLVENGVPGDGAAGSIHELVTDLSCDVDADAVAAKAGGGASCSFKP